MPLVPYSLTPINRCYRFQFKRSAISRYKPVDTAYASSF